MYICIFSFTYKLEHFDWEFGLVWCFDVIETIALCVLMLVDQKRRLFILASDAHDLFMMTNRIDNAYYAVCGFMVFLDAFPNISQYFLIVFSSNKVLRGILMTSYRPAWCGNYTRVGINILLGIPIVCIVWYWPSKRLLYFFVWFLDATDDRQIIRYVYRILIDISLRASTFGRHLSD